MRDMMSKSTSSEALTGAASLLEQVSRLVGRVIRDDGMHPAQWSAIRFFAEADEGARTTNGLAGFQGINAATASRTIASLSRRGLLTVEAKVEDRRVKIVTLTQAGRDILNEDPLATIAQSMENMTDERLEAMSADLEAIYLALSSARRR